MSQGMRLTDEQTSRIVDYLTDKPLKTVYVFGSYARGDADSESDLDLLVELDHASLVPLDLRKCSAELGAKLSLRVELFLEHSILKYARPAIWNERVLLATFQNRTILRQM